jgi:hypothetical protein
MPPTALFCLIWLCVLPQESSLPYSLPLAALTPPSDPGSASTDLPAAAILPVLAQPNKSTGIEWTAVSRSSLRFLAAMQAFRVATETDTRAGGFGLGAGYFRSITNLHGWADGDPYYVNYLGHPAQGAISARLLANHDPRFRGYEFGRDRFYWKGKLRAAAFSWAFSEQFEIGLMSEASLGHIQNRFPQQGFVDHVITPTVGLGLTLFEDSLDRYLIKPMEARTRNKWARLILRTGLNPTRSFANVMDKKAPWHRDTRAGILQYEADTRPKPGPPADSKEHLPIIAPVELRVASGYRRFTSGPCMGGGAEGAYRIAPRWQLLLDVNGCKLLGLTKNLSGDALFYQVGSRWTPRPVSKWSPYVQLLLGGMTVTHEQMFPEKKIAVERAFPNPAGDPDLAHRLHDLYTSSETRSGLAVSAGTGLDYLLNDALAIRVAGLEYSRSTVGVLGGLNYVSGFQLTTGMILRLGTW